MLKTLNDLRGYSIRAADGDLGTVKDVYFTDLSWLVRYLVVDTGHWLPGRRVLLSADVLQQPDPNDPVLHVDLSQTQVEQSPGIEADEPVSRQYEIALAHHYSWPAYWGERLAHGADQAMAAAEAVSAHDQSNPHLRSAIEVSGYHVQAADGEVGHVEDFVIDTVKWEVRYVVVDTKNWWPGEKVLISPRWIEWVDWPRQKAHVDVTRETIKAAPRFDPTTIIDRQYEEQLYDRYGRPKYWEDRLP